MFRLFTGLLLMLLVIPVVLTFKPSMPPLRLAVNPSFAPSLMDEKLDRPNLKQENTDYYSHEKPFLPYSGPLGELNHLNPNAYNTNQNYSYANFGDAQ